MAINVSQYVFKIFANRNLSKGEYGLLGTLLSLIQIVGIVSVVLKTWSTKAFSQIHSYGNHRAIPETHRYFFKIIGIFLAVFAVLFLVFLDPIMKMYKAADTMPFYLLMGIIVFEYVKIPLHSFLESFGNFLGRSIALLSTIVVKVGLLGVFLFFSLDLTKTMWAILIGYIFGFALFIVFSLPKVSKVDFQKMDSPDKEITQKNFSFFYKIGLAIVFSTLLQAIDMQLARIRLDEAISGDFATARDLGSIVYWFGTITLPLFFVSINTAFHKKQNYLPVFIKGLLIVLGVTAVGLFGFLIAIRPFVNFYNPIYLSAIDAIRYYAISSIPYILINVMLQFFVSLDRYKIFIPLSILAGGQAALFYFFGLSIGSMIDIRFYSGFVILGFMMIYFIIMRNKFYKAETAEQIPVAPIEEDVL
jgi:O-antigen/teichoic acid export membrane protein